MAKRIGKVQFAEARFEGASGLRADTDQAGWIVKDGVARSDLHTAVAAKGRAVIQNRKTERDDFEHAKAFEIFKRMPREVLDNKQKAKRALDEITDAIVAVTKRSLKQTRRRVGELRKEFLRLRA